MNELNIDELNQQIVQINFWDLKSYSSLPPMDSLEVITPNNRCSLDEREEVRKRIIGKPIPLDFDIKSDPYLTQCVCKFILDKKTSSEEKEAVCEYLDEELKKSIFELFIETELKTRFKPSIDDISGNIYYSPKVNGVPLKIMRRDDNNILRSSKIDANFDDVKDFLNQKNDKPNTGLLLSVRHLLNESNVINEKWCPKYIKNVINNLNDNTWEEYEKNMCDGNDQMMKEDLEKSQDAQHIVHASENLKKSIMDSIPSDFNTVEKAIYIYSKLCQILSYDPIYYLGGKSQYDKSVAKIENVDSENNGVVCYEFSYILADLLMGIGITKIKEHKLNGNEFHDEHSNISFLVNGLVIFADSTRSVIQGDLTAHKYSSEMKGIRCELYDEESQKEFSRSKNKVTEYINKENTRISSMIPSKDEIENYTLSERINIFNNLLISCGLKNTDFISYANRLISALELTNVGTKLFYNEEKNCFFMQVNLANNYGENVLSYMIDSSTKKVYDKPSELLKFSEDITGQHR